MAASRFGIWIVSVVGIVQFFGVDASAAKIQILGEPFQVNEGGMGEEPEVLALRDGGFVILWRDPSAKQEIRTRGRRFDAAGQPVGVEFVVEAGGHPPAAVRGDSLVMVSESNPGDQRIGLFDLEGVLQQAVPVPSADTLTVITNGDVVAAWSNQEFVRGSLIRFGDEPRETRFVIDDHTTDYQVNVRSAAAPDGSFVVLWLDDQRRMFWARTFEADATPRGGHFSVVESGELGDGFAPDLCFDSGTGNLVVVWAKSGIGDTRFRRLAIDGTLSSPVTCAGLGAFPSVSCLANDRFAMAGAMTEQGSGRVAVGLRAFDAENRAIGSAALLPSPASCSPKSAVLADGKVVVAWQDCDSNPDVGDIFTQTFTISSRTECPGDCNGDGNVALDELVTAVRIGLVGETDPRCPTLRSDVVGSLGCQVTVNALVMAVDSALRGCE